MSFNIYDICYAKTPQQRKAYFEYIDEIYSASKLTEIMGEVTQIIGANVLYVSHQDYDPQGASVTMLIAEEVANKTQPSGSELSKHIVSHLDKSHIAVHTYPESHPDNGICTFRTDIDVSTCGLISPLNALNFLIHTFDSDIVIVDYRVRGFTRDVAGDKHFIDQPMRSIQNYFTKEASQAYEMIDMNVEKENIFHTKMLLKHFNLNNYLFGVTAQSLSENEALRIHHQIKGEMLDIFHGRNL